ncbi:MAG: phosphate ABC transporter permease subunit PstC [Mycobacteriaceae bacterium]|nr:phosphate ABC transporter permease subunit PstC [Mycobacteriaceae bacterium]
MTDAPARPRTPGSESGAGGAGGSTAGTIDTPREETIAGSSTLETPADARSALRGGGSHRLGDLVFRSAATGAAGFITVVIAAIGLFLIWRAVPALRRNSVNFLFSSEWSTTDTAHMAFGVLDLLQLTILVSLFALVIAMPVALGIAIFLTSYAPKRIARPLAYMIDLLAAVPSVVYGLWGLLVFAPAIRPASVWLNEHLDWLFLFKTQPLTSVAGGGTVFTAGIVLAVMILPIITAVTREVFTQTPVMHIEAALALGATRWEVVRTTVIPFGKSGYVSGSMLGLGRALGETMALYLILRTSSAKFDWSLFDGGSTIASKIALGYAEFNSQIQAGAYIAAGLVLFVLTFAVNAAARAVIAGKRA